MDVKTIFVKTSKGEGEMHGKTSHLPDSLKRALLMVDGTSTFSEISKRAAPSMRASLGETFEELEKTGYILDKDKVGKTPKFAVPKMSVPAKTAKPPKQEPAGEDAGELDFLTGFPVTPPEKPVIVPANTKSLIDQTDEKARQRWEAEKYKAEDISARKEAEEKNRKAEQEAARIREEKLRHAKEQVEAARLKAEQEARRMREQAKAAQSGSGKDPNQLLEDAIREQQQAAEAKRLLSEPLAGKVPAGTETYKPETGQASDQLLEAAISEQRLASEAARVLADRVKKEREELDAARSKIEQESRQRLEAAAKERERAEAARIKAEQEAAQILIEMEMAKLKAEQEAKARLEAEAKARIEAEVKARLEAEAKARLEAEAKARLEAEVKARLESEAKEIARIKAGEEAAIARQAAELLARQEREAAAREAAARAVEAREAAARQAKAIEESPASGAAGFAFDHFQLEEPQNLAEPRKPGQPAQEHGAASEAARIRQGLEQKQREEQERIAAEERAKEIAEAKAKEAADAQAREIAEAQAKVWAEAEQRAQETARAKADRAVYQAEYTPAERKVERPVRAARVRREPFAWGKLVGFVFKLGFSLLVLLAIALYIIPFVLPMRDYMPKVQQLLSARLRQPVHLGNLSGRILPLPRLDLGEIYIGDAKQFQAVDAQINFDLMGLFIDEKPISSVEFHGVKVRGPWVTNVAGWLQQLASQDQYPVSRMVINQGTIDADAFQLTGVDGELDFDPTGKFTKADLHSDGGKYSMVLNASPLNRFQTTITIHNSALPLLPNWSFDELVAKGELSGDGLLIKHFDARIVDGTLQGHATINWRSGWMVQGALNAKALVINNINKLLDCKVDGDARFKMSSMNLAGLTDSASLDGSFKSTDGLISGMDIVETARMRSKEHLPGGRTRFDALTGNISFAGETFHFSQVKVDAGVMDATAAFEVTKQQLSGKMNVKLSIQDAVAPVALKMGGTTDSPTLIYAP